MKVNLKVISAIFIIMSCAGSLSCKQKIEYQKNGLACLNIKKPLKLKAYPTEYTGDGTFHDASYIAKDMKLGLNLGNTMEAYQANNCEKITFTWIPRIGSNTPSNYEQCWHAPVTTQEMIDGIKAAGFNTVRIPVFWGNMMENNGKWEINADYINRVREIVDYCMKDDLYAVVNIHHFDEFIIRRNNLEDCKTIITNIWTQIASYFQNYSEKLVFEGFNEYLGGQQFNEKGRLMDLPKKQAYELVNTLNDAFVQAVRSTGGQNKDRVLIISGYWTNIDLTSASAFLIPQDTASNKLMVSVHYVDNSMYWERKIGSQKWLDYIDNQIMKLDRAFADKGIPVFLGETTSGYPKQNITGDLYKTSPECLEYVLTKLTEHGFVPVLWDTENDWSFYNRRKACIRDEKNQEVINRIKDSLE
ncbi:MAG: glycoside hydrolase family 5 protein [Treponema sp.]|nr:glycoside hydrolase family 5 protein [Treponema sp.]